MTRRARPRAPLALVVLSSLVPPIALAALSLDVEGSAASTQAFADLGPGGVLALGYIVVVATFFGYRSWAWLMARHDASAVAPFTLLVPVVGISAAWLLLGERPGELELLGAAIVLVRLALVTVHRRTRPGGDVAAVGTPAAAPSTPARFQ